VSKPCTLSGSNLFLATSIGPAADFNNSTDIPPDFTGTQLNVPHPVNGTLYVKLRDDPATVQTVTLPVTLSNVSMGGMAPATQGPAPASAQPDAAPAAAPDPTVQAPAPSPKPDAPPRR